MKQSARDQIGVEDLPPQVRQSKSRVSSISLKLPDEGIDFEQVEKEILVQALERHNWNQTRAAGFLNISRKTLIYRMEKFGLAPGSDTASAIPSVET
jgi:two-component system NtrC family response regulator